MINYVLLGSGLIFLGLTFHYLIEFIKSFRGERYEILWRFIIFFISGVITFFGFYAYFKLDFVSMGKNASLFVGLFFIIGIINLIIIAKTFNIMDTFAKKKKRFMDLNFVLDSETREKADDLEEINKKLALQTEILSEKEFELKNMNADLLKAEADLEREKASVEKKVIERTKELRIEKERVESLLKQKTEFINQLSHDLRTPITPLLNLLPLLIDQTKDKENRKLAEICFKNSKYLEKLVLSTLSLARLETKSSKVELIKTSLHHLIDEIIKANHLTYKNENVQVSNKVSAAVKIPIDAIKMREVFENIITNAIKYNESRMKKIEIISELDKDYAILEFKDNGIGIESKYLNMIFNEFYKVDPSRHQHNSSGLGLSIAKKIVEMHNGRISALSDGLGKGTTITIMLPLKGGK